MSEAEPQGDADLVTLFILLLSVGTNLQFTILDETMGFSISKRVPSV